MKNDVILEKLSYQLADWNRGQAENRMNRLISQYGKKIELVMSNNDERWHWGRWRPIGKQAMPGKTGR